MGHVCGAGHAPLLAPQRSAHEEKSAPGRYRIWVKSCHLDLEGYWFAVRQAANEYALGYVAQGAPYVGGRQVRSEDSHCKVRSMTSDSPPETLSVQIANQIINIANSRHEDGLPVDVIAAGLRHAAANFSAFAFFRAEKKNADPDAIANEFVNLLINYLERHKPKEQSTPGLYKLIEQAKNEN
jgi:hypothetical protein